MATRNTMVRVHSGSIGSEHRGRRRHRDETSRDADTNNVESVSALLDEAQTQFSAARLWSAKLKAPRRHEHVYEAELAELDM